MTEIADEFFDSPNEGIDADPNSFNALVRQYLELEAEISVAKSHLNDMTTRLNEIVNKDMPAAMTELGLEEFKDSETRIKFKLHQAVNGTLPRDEDKRTEILEVLRPHGVDELVSNTVEFKLPKGDNRAAMLMDIARKEGLAATQLSGINAQTFGAWLRELVAQGKGHVLDAAGIWHGRVVKVIKPRK